MGRSNAHFVYVCFFLREAQLSYAFIFDMFQEVILEELVNDCVPIRLGMLVRSIEFFLIGDIEKVIGEKLTWV